jgi:UDP-4-amino-4,6-dideoxy-N-acetyl-beta-L-altrosamine N-acetyltransferase
MYKACKIRNVNEKDLPMLLEWRNHPDIRQFMFTTHLIESSEHNRWFETANQDKSRRLLIVMESENPLGFVQFSKVEAGGVADWGFYVRPNSPRGKGKLVGIAALNHAFINLKLHKVCGQAIASNNLSIKFHQRLGFQLEGLLRDQYFNDDKYQNIYCFGLIIDEWKSKKIFQESV